MQHSFPTRRSSDRGVRNDHGGAKFFAQLFQSAPGQCKGFGLARVGIDDQVGTPGQIVDDNQFIDLQKHDVGRAAVLAGRERLYCWAKARFDMTRSEEHTSELQSLMRLSYAVFCLKK